jgi:hypothetical protein
LGFFLLSHVRHEGGEKREYVFERVPEVLAG